MPALSAHDLYDEFPYRSRPIEWTAPERLALCSMLHAGPRAALDSYSVLELGCGDGSNLIPLAFYRQQARFVGLDSSAHAIGVAEARCKELELANVQLVHSTFGEARRSLRDSFDFIIAHGVCSWISPSERDQLMDLCSERLAPGGLLYLNYNTKPGWVVRGMVRDFLRAQTAHIEELAARARAAQEVAATAAAAHAGVEHPYAQLMEREYRFVCEGHPTYVAHEFLAPENHAFWQSEMRALLATRGLHYLADADFNYASGRVADDLLKRIEACGWRGTAPNDATDLFCYRQLHSAIYGKRPAQQQPRTEELAELWLASPMQALSNADGAQRFRHPSGYEVAVTEQPLSRALSQVGTLWPRGLRMRDLLPNLASHVEDLLLLHRHGLLELRLVEPEQNSPSPRLAQLEQRWGGYVTDPYHRHALLNAEP